MLPGKVYTVLKWVSIVFLPALTTFVGVILNCFQVDCAEIVLTIMVAFDTFLGAILGVSTKAYNNKVVSDENGEQ